MVFSTAAERAYCLSPNLYIRVRSANCSSSRLILRVEGLTDLPKSVLLKITKDEGAELVSTTVDLAGQEYVWTGSIPLGDFTASILIGKTLLSQKFTNLKLLQQFQNRMSTLIQVRSSGDPVNRSPQTKILQKIQVPSVGSNARLVHLLLIGPDNKLAEQYLGTPLDSWTVEVVEGNYKLVAITYYRDGSPCRIDTQHP
jgi:hypothetical protein